MYPPGIFQILDTKIEPVEIQSIDLKPICDFESVTTGRNGLVVPNYFSRNFLLKENYTAFENLRSKLLTDQGLSSLCNNLHHPVTISHKIQKPDGSEQWEKFHFALLSKNYLGVVFVSILAHPALYHSIDALREGEVSVKERDGKTSVHPRAIDDLEKLFHASLLATVNAAKRPLLITYPENVAYEKVNGRWKLRFGTQVLFQSDTEGPLEISEYTPSKRFMVTPPRSYFFAYTEECRDMMNRIAHSMIQQFEIYATLKSYIQITSTMPKGRSTDILLPDARAEKSINQLFSRMLHTKIEKNPWQQRVSLKPANAFQL